MLTPVNGSDWQFITADSHSAECGPGRGTSPPGTLLEEIIPFVPSQASSPGKAATCLQSVQGENKRTTVRAWLGVSAAEAGTTRCHSHPWAWSEWLQPWPWPLPCAGVAVPALPREGAAAGGGEVFCHPRRHRCGSEGLGVHLVIGKSSRFGCSPKQGG